MWLISSSFMCISRLAVRCYFQKIRGLLAGGGASNAEVFFFSACHQPNVRHTTATYRLSTVQTIRHNYTHPHDNVSIKSQAQMSEVVYNFCPWCNQGRGVSTSALNMSMRHESKELWTTGLVVDSSRCFNSHSRGCKSLVRRLKG